MFSQILSELNVNVESSFDVSDALPHTFGLVEESRLQYEEAEIELMEKRKEMPDYEEQQCVIENGRIKLKSEMASQVEIRDNLEKQVKDLNNLIQSTEVSLKKFSKMRPSSIDLKTFTRVKKIFGIYKRMLNVYFDFDNYKKAAIQKGYTINKIIKKVAYFQFNKNEKTADEISTYVYCKIKSVSTFR